MNLSSHILTSIIFMPVIGIFVLMFLPERWRTCARVVSLVSSLLTLAACALCFHFIDGTGDFEIIEHAAWVPQLGISYSLGVDGASISLILLAAMLTPVSIIASWKEIQKRVKLFHILILVLEIGMLGVFAALDVFLFYIFWEVVLIPMYFLIGIWGSGNRIRTAIKFVLFTMFGSVLMLVAIIYSGKVCQSFDLLSWYAHTFSVTEQLLLFAAFSLAFAIKVPLIGFHTWLPDAHSEAPTAGSILLAGVLLKMGAYGFFRFAMPLFPAAVVAFAPTILVLSVASIILGALLSMVQPDIKRLIAYSSVSHMGFIILGLIALEENASAGAILQMVNHGITTGALFLMVGMLYGRRHTRMIADFGGTARSLPVLSVFFILLAFSSMGLPGLNNFVGEFLILLGSFQTQTLYTSVAIFGVVLVAIYLLWAVLRVFFGPLKHEEEKSLSDLTPREYTALLPLVILIFVLGVRPEFLLDKLWGPAASFIKLSKRLVVIPADVGGDPVRFFTGFPPTTRGNDIPFKKTNGN